MLALPTGAVFAQAVQQEVPRVARPSGEGHPERIVFDQRVAQLLDCWQSWLGTAAALDEEQRTAIAAAIQQRVPEAAEKHWLISHKAVRSALANHFPVLFVETKTPLSELLQPITVESLLREEQSRKLQAALAERREFHFAANRDYALAILDAELFLSPEQRRAWTAEGDFLSTQLDEPYFFTHPSPSTYLPYRSIVKIVPPNLLPLFSQEQRQWLTRLEAIAANPPPGLSFRSDEAREEWTARLDAFVRDCRDEVLLKLTLRANELEREGITQPPDADQLRTAAKGAAVSVSGAIQGSVRESLDAFEARLHRNVRPGGYSIFSASVLNSERDHPETHALWVAARAQLRSVEAGQRLDASRRDRHRQARDRAVVAMLDRELWLRPEQREQLLPLLSAALPPVESVPPNREPLRDVTWLAHAFCLTNAAKLQEMLDPVQWNSWRQMQNCAPLIQDMSPPRVGVLLRGNRQMMVLLLNADGRGWEIERKGDPPGSAPQVPQNIQLGNH